MALVHVLPLYYTPPSSFCNTRFVYPCLLALLHSALRNSVSSSRFVTAEETTVVDDPDKGKCGGGVQLRQQWKHHQKGAQRKKMIGRVPAATMNQRGIEMPREGGSEGGVGSLSVSVCVCVIREQSVGVLEQNRVSCWLAVTPWYRQKRRQSAGTVAAHIISGAVDPTEQEQEQEQ